MRAWLLALAASLAACGRCGDAGPTADRSLPRDASVEAPPASAGAPTDSVSSATDSTPWQRAGDRARAEAEVPAIGAGRFDRDRGEAEVYVAGIADARSRRPCLSSTPFQVASIAKIVIGIAVMQLVEARRLALDVDVSSVLGFPVRGAGGARPVTLRRLLTHTAGLRDRREVLASATREEPLGPFLEHYLADAGSSAAKATAKPGYTYSNAGAALAALAVERAARMPYDKYVYTHIFAPAKIGTCAFRPPDAAAVPHAAAPDGGLMPLRQASHALYPVVDLWCSTGDVLRIGRVLLGRGAVDGARLLPAARVDEMLRPASGTLESGQGLGVQLRTIGGRAVVGHEGEDAGSSTGLYVDLERGAVVTALANGDAFASGSPRRARAISRLIGTLLQPL